MSPHTPSSFLQKNRWRGATVSTALLLVIMAFSLGLHLVNLEAIGNANEYYTAAVKSMLLSWSNFFFVAAEPGGSVTIDKPPLGLWIEAVFAYFLGVSGFSVSLPNMLAGVFGLPLLYGMVKKHAGEPAGLVSALVMAITPIFVATNRNNTMDGLLVFFLLLAAWAFIRATETGKLRWLLLGAFIVGLGFNIKMMQAFLPLPAFYALYFFASKEGWRRKIVNLGLATVLLVAVSLSWAVAVDLTPADQRPYIGSSGDNTVMGLIFGHNGVSRLGNTGGPGGGNAPQAGSASRPGQTPPQAALEACANATPGADCSFTERNRTTEGTCIIPPNSSELACAPAGMIPAGQAPAGKNSTGSTQFSAETGDPGLLRFFTSPLSKQMSWLLPFALIGLVVTLFGARVKLPVEAGIHKALILWGGWLLTCMAFLSMISGIFHSYYAIMLAPALGAMVGSGFAQLWDWGADKKWAGVALAGAATLTMGFQYFSALQYGESSWWLAGSGLLLGLGLILLVARKRAAYLTLLAAMLVIPLYWTVMSVVTTGNQRLPTAYSGGGQQAGDARPQAGASQPGQGQSAELVTFLNKNTQDVEYLVAVPSSDEGAQFVLDTGRPVLYIGGFNGGDEVVGVEDLSAMVANDELRYVLFSDERGNKADIASWLETACTALPEFSRTASTKQASPAQGPGMQASTLYFCQ
jgi:4-amino-4-deoxy-L-arabinose transferase-like glycosyltransferase